MSAQILTNQTLNKSQVHHGKCVCQACSCGKHKCPDPIKKGQYHSSYNADFQKYQDFKPQGKYKMIHKNFILPDDKFQNLTSYTDDYNKKGASRPPQKFKPVGELSLSNSPFQANTSYIQDYLNRGQAQRAQKVQLPKNFVMPNGRFDGSSSYNQNYIGGRVQKQQQFRPVGELKTGGNFQGVSSYLIDYENKGVGLKAQRVPLPRNQVFPQGAFEGNTNYNSNYVNSKAQKLQQFRPQGQIKLGGNFQGNSSYVTDFNGKGGQRSERYPLPQNQVMPDGKFQGNSNYSENYILTKAQRQKQVKPEGQLKIGGDFNGNSSYQADFANKGSGIKAERVTHPKNEVMPLGRFQGNSAYTSDYVGTRVEKNPQFRPTGQLKVGDGKFQGLSSYSNDYLNKGTPPKIERVPLPKNHVMPEGKFDSTSTYTDNYIPTQIKRQHCACQQLHAPKHQVATSQHVRWNAKTQRWQ